MGFIENKGEVGPVYVFGCGAVGTALTVRMASAGVHIVGAHCRTPASAMRAARKVGFEVTSGDDVPVTLGDARLILVAVPDPVIGAVAQHLATSGVVHDEQVAFHCSGARNADDLASLRPRLRGVASFHPLLSFADPEIAARLLPVAAFAVEGDAVAVAEAERLIEILGGRPLRVEAEDRVLYHAAAATASNHLVALAAQTVACLEMLGIEKGEGTRALIPLMQSTLDNLGRLGLPQALTGPVSRGDRECVAGHLAGIDEKIPSELLPYVVMARRALEVARSQGVAEPEALSEVEALLDEWLDDDVRRRP